MNTLWTLIKGVFGKFDPLPEKKRSTLGSELRGRQKAAEKALTVFIKETQVLTPATLSLVRAVRHLINIR